MTYTRTSYSSSLAQPIQNLNILKISRWKKVQPFSLENWVDSATLPPSNGRILDPPPITFVQGLRKTLRS